MRIPDDRGARAWSEELVELHGVDPAVASRTIWVTVALTSTRLLLVRRSRSTGRPREELASWPLSEVDHLTVSRVSGTLRIGRSRAELAFELPLAPKFLDSVYFRLPDLFDQARSEAP